MIFILKLQENCTNLVSTKIVKLNKLKYKKIYCYFIFILYGINI